MKRMAWWMASLALAAPAFAADVFEIDSTHTEIGFTVRHLMVSTVRGKFGAFSGTVEVDPADFSTLKASAKVETASIDTDNAKRDDHLRSPDFFDAANHPEITFVSSRVESSGGGEYVLHGDLTMRGVTKPIAIPISVSGPVTDPWGNTRVGFDGSTKINRKDWGINWSKTMDNGGLVVSEEVKIEISIEAMKPAVPPAG